jgi:C4-dicarboxylate transporter DctM subunit
MTSEMVGLMGVGAFLILLALGVPIAFAGALTGFLGLWYLAGISPAMGALGLIPYSEAASYNFTVLPLFIIMGYFAFYSGLATRAFDTGKRWIGHLHGGLALATVIAGAALAACCGMSVASAAITGKLVIPEMEKLRYQPRLITGVVAACGTLATMIPPSSTLVVYAIMTEVSVGKCLIAGVIPGLINAFLYGVLLYLRAKWNPSLTGGLTSPYPWRERLRSVPQVWGVVAIAAVIIGGIYTGIFSPTEAAAIAALISVFLFLILRKSGGRWSIFRQALFETSRATGMIFLIMIGIVIFSRFQAMSRLPYSFVEWISGLGLNRYVIIVLIMGLFFVLGMFVETMGILLLSIPVTYPLILSLGFDPIWYGVFVVKNIEMGMLTPPVGLNIYVIKGLYPQYRLEDVFMGAMPFLIVDFVVLALLIVFPEIALFLPGRM